MKAIFIVLLCLLASCKTVKYAINEKITSKESCVKISTKGIPVFEAEIENNLHQLIFDTGAMASVVIDSSIIEDFSNKKMATFGSHAGADRKKKKNRILTVKIKSALFESDNKIMLFSQMPKGVCSKPSAIKGIIGLDAFFENDLSLFLDFSNSKICNINAIEMNSRLTDGLFKQLKSECRQNQIFVFLMIDGKEYKFKLDTGYSGNVIISYSDKLDFSKYNSMALEGALYTTIGSVTKGMDVFYEKVPVEIANEKASLKIAVSKSIKAQNIGIDFIKAFDWLIDYNNNKVYVKRNQNPIESIISRKISYYAKVNQDKLLIVVKEKSQTKYQLGNQIISVNGQKVTTENQCELQDLLNKTDDWNSLQLEVIPTQQ